MEPSSRVGPVGHAGESTGDISKQGVAIVRTESVVDLTKPIQTQNAQTEGALLSSRLIDFLSQSSLKEPTGGKFGERIAFRAIS